MSPSLTKLICVSNLTIRIVAFQAKSGGVNPTLTLQIFMTEEIIPNNTKSIVPLKYYEMFGLRIMGLTYKQIAEKTDYSEAHIKLLFSNNGVLGKLWADWLEKAKGDNVEESLSMMFGHLPDIVRANIIDAKQMGTPTAIAARKMIFEYTLGKPEEKLKFDGRLGIFTFADWIKAETLKDQQNGQTTLPKEPD